MVAWLPEGSFGNDPAGGNDFVCQGLKLTAGALLPGGVRADRFPLTTVARTTKQALAFGVMFGGLQDVLALARGQPVGYVDFVRRRLGSR